MHGFTIIILKFRKKYAILHLDVNDKDTEFDQKPHKVSGMLLYAVTDEAIQPDNSYQMSGNQISVKTIHLYRDFFGDCFTAICDCGRAFRNHNGRLDAKRAGEWYGRSG